MMKRLKDGEGKGGAKVTPWIDSMRASSPPRVRPTVHDCDNLDLLCPLALNVPRESIHDRKMREAVKDIARHFPTSIMTGRCVDKVYNFVRLA
ncbi:hypothetical protein K1719_015862 [Acacia pycnantha]|nr:hypothetical protein K1719_015862 [Acacia pycnantha]